MNPMTLLHGFVKIVHLPSPKSGFYADRPWYYPIAVVRRLINYYLLICVALFLMQNSLLYPRWMSGAALKTEDAVSQAKVYGLVPWDQTTSGASAPQGYVLPNFAAPASRGTIVLFHGNGGWALDRGQYVDAFIQRGFRIFLYEYPGYGGRPGHPSEAAIVPDAQALIRSLDQAGYGPVYVWGESLGAGVAAAVCADENLPVHGLVLLTPWDTLAHTAGAYYPFVPVAMLLSDKYDSISNLQHFRHPICEVRCTQDKVIPPRLNLNLYAHLPEPKKMIVLEGCGHDDWPYAPDLSWWDNALDFIAPRN
jgi:hypothetical protein